MTDSGPGAGRAVNADGGPPPSRATPSRTPVLGPGAPSSRSVRSRAAPTIWTASGGWLAHRQAVQELIWPELNKIVV